MRLGYFKSSDYNEVKRSCELAVGRSDMFKSIMGNEGVYAFLDNLVMYLAAKYVRPNGAEELTVFGINDIRQAVPTNMRDSVGRVCFTYAQLIGSCNTPKFDQIIESDIPLNSISEIMHEEGFRVCTEPNRSVTTSADMAAMPIGSYFVGLRSIREEQEREAIEKSLYTYWPFGPSNKYKFLQSIASYLGVKCVSPVSVERQVDYSIIDVVAGAPDAIQYEVLDTMMAYSKLSNIPEKQLSRRIIRQEFPKSSIRRILGHYGYYRNLDH